MKREPEIRFNNDWSEPYWITRPFENRPPPELLARAYEDERKRAKACAPTTEHR